MCCVTSVASYACRIAYLLIIFTKCDRLCYCTACKLSWNKMVDVWSTGSTSLAISPCSLTACLDYCAHSIDCIGIQYNIVTAMCAYFPTAQSVAMTTTATPTPQTVQYRLVDSCKTGKE